MLTLSYCNLMVYSLHRMVCQVSDGGMMETDGLLTNQPSGAENDRINIGILS